MGAKAHPVVGRNVAPIYLPVYPVGSNVGTLNCQDTTVDTVENCPDHGPLVAQLAESLDPTVYGTPEDPNVAGHDHLVGIASSGGDFNILWEPVLVLFNPGVTVTHITTLAQLRALYNTDPAKSSVIEVHLPPATFNCAVVPASVYNLGTPYHI